MRLNRHTWRMIVLTAAVVLAAALFGQRGGGGRTDCTVALVPRSGMTILSQNPVRVKRGGDAAFTVQLDPGYHHDEASGLRYENGVLYLDDVRDPRSVQYVPRRECSLTVRDADRGYVEILSGDTVLTGSTAEIRVAAPAHYTVTQVLVNGEGHAVSPAGTVSFQVRGDSDIALDMQGEPVAFSVASDPAGSVRNLSEREEYRYGDTVALRSACASPSVHFDGWSTGAYLSDGGTKLSSDQDIVLTLSGDTRVYANFTDTHTYVVTIDPNGGEASGAVACTDLSAGRPAYLPADTGVLSRKGHVLTGYNTQPDGAGQHYALSAPIMMGEGNVTLYAEWVPVTPADALSYETKDGFVVIKGVSRDIGDTLALPARIDGKPVRRVESRAFAGNAALRTVVLPLGVTRVEKEAFAECPSLSTVYLPKTLISLSPTAFRDCPSFKRLRLLTDTETRVYEDTFDAALADRYERLTATEGKRIIFVAGSSGSFGLDSNLLAERYPDYQIVNFSGSYLYGILPMACLVREHIHQGDVVIFAPEYYEGMYASELNTEIENWMYLESNYNMLEDLDMQLVGRSILSPFVEFFTEREKILPGKQEPHGMYVRTVFNEYGDVSAERGNKKETNPSLPDADIIESAGVDAYAEVFSSIAARGGTCLFSFPPVSDGNASKDRLRSDYDSFTQKVEQSFAGLPCTVISDAADYIFPASVFYDSRYHMTLEGAKLRTQQLIADLDASGILR